MLKWTIAMGLIVSAGICATPQPQDCWPSERRTFAIRLARQINTAEAAASMLSRRYVELSALHVPPSPAGFQVQLSTDGKTYTFSVKDGLEPCHRAVFSDQNGVIYTATPLE